MLQFVQCNGCGNRIRIPETGATQPVSRFFRCDECGQEIFWDAGLTETAGQLVIFSIEDATQPQPLQEIETAEEEKILDLEQFDSSVGLRFDSNLSAEATETHDTPLELELELELEAEEQKAEAQEMDQESIYPGVWHGNAEVEVDADIEVPEIEHSVSAVLSAASPATEWSVLGPMTPRKRPKEVSAMRKIVPPILGGLAAFPIATIIMWYGFGKDIGSTGPTVAKYVPWIVPPSLRNEPWNYPPLDSRNTASSQPKIDRQNGINASGQRNLPRLNTGDSRNGDSQDLDDAVHSQFVPERKAPYVNEPRIEEPSISVTIAKLRKMQNEWENWENASRQDKEKVLAEYYSEACRLSNLASRLKGRSALIWQKELESISREILSHARIPKAIKWCSEGKLSAVGNAMPNDFIATVIQLVESDHPTSNATWTLAQTLPRGDLRIPIEISPRAWRAGAVTKPKTCIALGQLSLRDSTANTSEPESGAEDLVFQVHLLLPE